MLENGLHRHNAEVGEIRKQMNTIRSFNEPESQIHQNNNNNNKLDQNEMFKESIINADMTYRGEGRDQCKMNPNIIPKPDIQVIYTYSAIRETHLKENILDARFIQRNSIR